THRTGGHAVHKANTKEDTEAILNRLDEKAITMMVDNGRYLAANPQAQHWEAYIEACYREIAAGRLAEGVDRDLASQEVSRLAEAFAKDAQDVEEVIADSFTFVGRALRRSITNAFDVDHARLAHALQGSVKDGDESA